MGKKKVPKKTKELSVAIAESSSIIGEQITPRKRGRPRKIVERIEEVKESKEDSQQDLDEEPESKKQKSTEEHESKKPKSTEDMVKTEATSRTQDQPRRSRRKSKPRKSS
ncbi:hypothetical protein Tco_0745010 [Tanacetum coccineum]